MRVLSWVFEKTLTGIVLIPFVLLWMIAYPINFFDRLIQRIQNGGNKP